MFNVTPVINPAGEVIARYRKMYPFLPYEAGVASGDSFCVFDVPGIARFGISICYDMWFPETTRTLAWMGAEAIIHPTMTNTIDRDAELAIARANAAQNQLYFIDINVAGRMGFGRSIAYGPGGELLHAAGTGHEAIALELDFEHVRHVRERGWNGIGQMLKSFRDTPIDYPQYRSGARKSPSLESLGRLERPPEFPTAFDAEDRP
ncbi:MAG: carbon-nitrogen hydrolase family protein [Micropepsaceae bacterium]